MRTLLRPVRFLWLVFFPGFFLLLLLPLRAADNSIQEGEALAKAVCVSCHLFPEPRMLDKVTWGLEVLPKMANWLGGQPYDFAAHAGGERVRAAHIIPEAPIISVDQWRQIASYYLENAPGVLPPATNALSVSTNLTKFRTRRVSLMGGKVPMTTLLQVDSVKHRLFVGDTGTRTLSILDGSGKLHARLPLDNLPVAMTWVKEGFFLTQIGEFFGSDEPRGKITFYDTTQPGMPRPTVIADALQRPTDLQMADLNGDGRLDLIVCNFGNLLGHLSWWEALPQGGYREHELLNRPGAIRTVVRDFTGHGRLDILVLMAQAREGVFLLENKGNGEFVERTLLEFPPMWGSSGMEVVDFDGDGLPDLLISNGDNGDSTHIAPPVKPYHGVRLYHNEGGMRFREAWFVPMPGAYHAVARDFRGVGKLDVAAVSFYPDLNTAPLSGFVYLENQGNDAAGKPRFTAQTVPEAGLGRWLTMAAGDLRGDGVEDIVIGSFRDGFNPVPDAVNQAWEQGKVQLLILENQRHKDAAEKH